MLKKIEACYDQEELHQMGLDIDLSPADNSMKKPYYEAIESQLKKLNSVMATSESSEVSDLYEFYNGDV